MKQKIYDYVNTLMTAQTAYPVFAGKIFWANTRLEEPLKPYLLMTVINDETIHRTSEVGGLVKEYRQATITFRLCFDGALTTNDALCEEIIDFLRENLSSEEAVDYFQENLMSNRWENISATRDMTSAVNGGFIYIREFDIPFEYQVSLQKVVKQSRGVKATVAGSGKVIDFLIDNSEENE